MVVWQSEIIFVLLFIRYRLLRHCSKIFVSSSLSLGAWIQRVPSGEDRAETLAVQLQVRNLRDVRTNLRHFKRIKINSCFIKADDTSLSGIEVYQVALLSDRWRLRQSQSTLPGSV